MWGCHPEAKPRDLLWITLTPAATWDRLPHQYRSSDCPKESMPALRRFVRLAVAIAIVLLLPFASPSSAQELKIAVAAAVPSADPHFCHRLPNNHSPEPSCT